VISQVGRPLNRWDTDFCSVFVVSEDNQLHWRSTDCGFWVGRRLPPFCGRIAAITRYLGFDSGIGAGIGRFLRHRIFQFAICVFIAREVIGMKKGPGVTVFISIASINAIDRLAVL
jgi:hypothetical protein